MKSPTSPSEEASRSIYDLYWLPERRSRSAQVGVNDGGAGAPVVAERRLLEDGISVRCLVGEDADPVDDTESHGVDAIVARAS